MKKNYLLNYLLLICSLFLVLHSCKSDDSDYIVQTYKLDAKLSVEDKYNGIEIPFQLTKLNITDKRNGAEFTYSSNEQGIVSISGLRNSSYEIKVVLEIEAETYNKIIEGNSEELMPISNNEKFRFTSLIENIDIDSDKSIDIDLNALVQSNGGLVFKQIYYAGSDLTLGAAYRDQFVEIYNNSSETKYLDGICLGKLVGAGRNKPQWDWTQSIGMPSNIKANEDYVYADQLFMFPGNGNQFPIESGKSVIVAGTAIDHTKTYTNEEGGETTIEEPELTVDLSRADFDVYLDPWFKENHYKYVPNKFKNDLNTVGIEKMIVIRVGFKDVDMRFAGTTSLVLVERPENENPINWPTYYAPNPNVTPDKTSDKYVQIPIKYIMDGVEIVDPRPDKRAPRRLPKEIDGGNTFVPKGVYSSQSLIRKTLMVENGRRILKDTNNSSEDFDYFDKAVSSKGEDSFK